MSYFRILLMIVFSILPQFVMGQGYKKVCSLVEKAIHSRTGKDVCDAYSCIIQERDVNRIGVNIKQISKALKDDEIIVEFFDRLDSLGCSTYLAFVIKKGMKAPQLYNIFKETELTSLIDEGKNFYNEANVLTSILDPLEDELQGVKVIYYTPSGKLHEIALEYCMDVNGKMFCENYDVYRLTSFSLICNRHHRKDYHHYSIWGGVDIEETQFDCQEDTCLITYDTRQFYYLEDSFKAAKLIVEELKEDNETTVDFFHDDTATESNFKTMSGNDIDAFLIETHGIFTRECSISPKSNRAPLDNYALALCGAASVMDTGIVPTGYEDGLITEEEIAKLDFSSMDLAVISACRSGLGDVKWDGVRGLMRGFKIAGVNILVMTLDDVVDYVSGQLWIQFFRNLTNGQSKREALLNGIKFIRTMDNGAYSHPRLWTPFILIDGVE